MRHGIGGRFSFSGLVPPCSCEVDGCLGRLLQTYEARLSLLTSVSTKVESWEVMALLPPLIVGLTVAAPLLQMLPVRLALISSQDALVSPREIALVNWKNSKF